MGFLQWFCYKPMSPSSKKQGVLNWKCLGLYVTRQLIWRQTPKFFITVYWKKKSHEQDILPKKSSNQSIVLYILWDAFHELFCVFGDFYASGMQDTEVTQSLLLALWAARLNYWFTSNCCTSCVAVQLFLREKLVKDFTCYWYMKTT